MLSRSQAGPKRGDDGVDCFRVLLPRLGHPVLRQRCVHCTAQLCSQAGDKFSATMALTACEASCIVWRAQRVHICARCVHSCDQSSKLCSKPCALFTGWQGMRIRWRCLRQGPPAWSEALSTQRCSQLPCCVHSYAHSSVHRLARNADTMALTAFGSSCMVWCAVRGSVCSTERAPAPCNGKKCG